MTQRIAGRIITTVIALFALGCTRAGDSAPGGSPTTRTTSLPGDLPARYDAIHPESLYVFGEDLFYVPTDTGRRDCDSAKCLGQIMAVANQGKFDSLNVSPNGTIVAKLVNLGRRNNGTNAGPEKMYRTDFSADSSRTFYLIAYSDGPEKWKWTVREGIRSGGSGVAAEKSAGDWVDCKHTPGPPMGHPKAKSKFWSCKNTGGSGAAVLNPEDEPGWLSCSAGCCTAGQ